MNKIMESLLRASLLKQYEVTAVHAQFDSMSIANVSQIRYCDKTEELIILIMDYLVQAILCKSYIFD